MNITLNIKQSQHLSARTMQNLEVLQMGSTQLIEYIENLKQENPTFDIEETKDEHGEIDSFADKLKWLQANDVQNKVYYRNDEADSYDPLDFYSRDGKQTLNSHLLDQLAAMDLPPILLMTAKFIVNCLDERGYLTESDSEIAEVLGINTEFVVKAVALVQSLEPIGSGARSLSDCLLIQLRDLEAPLAESIVENHLTSLGRNHYSRIAKELGADEEEVLEACDIIRSLNPRPAAGFAAKEESVYISPDLFVVSFPDHFELLANDYYFPDLKINTYYSSLYKDDIDKEVKDYLSDKLRQAKWAIGSIGQRKEMILRCAERIVERQEMFFRYGPGNLAPMTLADLAAELDVHESTISRAVKNKYLQCSSGIYPLIYFFSRKIGAEDSDATSDQACAQIKEIIEGEDAKKPYSDAVISTMLGEKGIEISRRTVTKYRDILGIGSTHMRRQR